MMRPVDNMEGLDPRQKEKLRLATKAFADAICLIRSDFWHVCRSFGQHFLQDSGESVKVGGISPADKARRFAAKQWQEDPFFDRIRQSYLLTANAMMRLVDTVDGIDPRQKEKLRFATKAFVDAMSPSNFALTNPLVLEKIQEKGGENLLRGLQNMLADQNGRAHV